MLPVGLGNTSSEFGELCIAHRDSSLWLTGLGDCTHTPHTQCTGKYAARGLITHVQNTKMIQKFTRPSWYFSSDLKLGKLTCVWASCVFICVCQGVVCTLHEGDDFGKLALVTDSPRAASIVLREDNCHFLRVDKEDFNRILRVGRQLSLIWSKLLKPASAFLFPNDYE